MICRASAENISIISKSSKLFRDDVAIFEVIQTEKQANTKDYTLPLLCEIYTLLFVQINGT